ncbi:MAG: helix-turn-helix transcriptional regulator [Eggerthellaceae bacterium]|nr:helix-turn-helix transcriptional regulator [Eggerthellaceae bacterium]
MIIYVDAVVDLSRKQFGAHLRSLRLNRGMTQKDLSSSSMLSARYISDIECGRRGIRFVNTCRLARGLGVPVSELLDFDDADLADTSQ